MELDAGTQLDRIGFSVRADFGQAFCQQWRRLPFLVEGVERFENMLRHDTHKIGSGYHRVERRRFADGRDIDNAALVQCQRNTGTEDHGRSQKEC